MTLRVVGAGLGRTGTHSLKLALEQLLGGPCYHMSELIDREDDTAVWAAATRGEDVDWASFLSGFAATVDWPACAFWEQIAVGGARRRSCALGARVAGGLVEERRADDRPGAPEAPCRPTTQAWKERRRMVISMVESTFTPDWRRPRRRHRGVRTPQRARPRRRSPAERLVEWRPGDGWEPICAALGLEIPAEPFPHTNTTAEFRAAQRPGLEAHSGYDSVDGEEVMERMRKPLTRLTEPLVREDGALRPATWDEALDRAADGFRAAAAAGGPNAFGLFSCSKASNEMNFMMQKFARVVMGSNNVDSCNRT